MLHEKSELKMIYMDSKLFFSFYFRKAKKLPSILQLEIPYRTKIYKTLKKAIGFKRKQKLTQINLKKLK